jgi:hypothetical protein
MSRFQAFQRQYFSQFVVAGRTFNRNALQRVMLSNEVQALNPAAYTKMKLLNLVGLMSTFTVIPIVANYYLTGTPFGRPGTDVGKIDTGKDDAQGRHITIDPGQTELIRRGVRISGAQALMKGIREEKSAGETLGNMGRDIVKGIVQPWEGPPVRVAMEGITSYAKERDMGESIVAAMKAVNPTITAAFLPEEGQSGGAKGVVEQLGGSVGVGKTRMPTHAERVAEEVKKFGGDTTNLRDRARGEKAYRETRTPLTEDARINSAESSLKRMEKRRQAVLSSMSKEDQKWLTDNNIRAPGFGSETLVGAIPGIKKGTEVYWTDEESKAAEKFYKEEYEGTVAYLRNIPAFQQMTENQKQVYANKKFVEAAARARKNIERELKRGTLVK